MARYERRPPLAATSRLTVDGARPNRDAMHLIDSPAANPRLISSRSPSDNRSGDHTRSGIGRRQPDDTSNVRIDDGDRPTALLIDR